MIVVHAALAVFDEKEKDATENLGDSEIRSVTYCVLCMHVRT